MQVKAETTATSQMAMAAAPIARLKQAPPALTAEQESEIPVHCLHAVTARGTGPTLETMETQ